MSTLLQEDQFALWVSNKLTEKEQQKFINFGLGHVLDLHSMKINWDLLHAAASCWDKSRHLFQFGTHHLCPTIDEFNELLGAVHNKPLIRPKKSHKKDIIEFFGLNNAAFSHYCHRDLLHINQLVSLFTNHKDSHKKLRALCVCALGKLLLQHDKQGTRVSTLVIEVVKALEKGAAIIPTVLGEIFDSLDSFDVDHCIKGSPYLLEIWLVEHLKLRTYPDQLYYINQIKAFHERKPIIRPKKDDEEWLKDLPHTHVQWHLTYLGIKKPLLCTGGHNIVSFMSLTQRSFYCPALVFRQFGLVQDTPSLDGKFFGVSPLSPTIIDKTAESWLKREYLVDKGDIVERPCATSSFKAWISSFAFFEPTHLGKRTRTSSYDDLLAAMTHIDQLNKIIEEKDKEIALLREEKDKETASLRAMLAEKKTPQ